ncbi:MAG TPA: hypothetical protein VFK41_13140, partial [Nocardioidaceae bacterium]|nr:hypothetical protein [Nocardioidaceae bacterium]
MVLVKLLGRPALVRDGGEVAGPRGNKAWAVLAYLVAASAPVPRERLVSMLFPDASDGPAALRWSLAELRRALDNPAAFAGDPVMLALGPGVRVDVELLATSPWYEVTDLADVTEPYLQGMALTGCPGFELWLDGERRRIAGLSAAVLRDAARSEIAAGRPDEA